MAPLLLTRKSESHMSGQYVIERELSLLVCYYVEEVVVVGGGDGGGWW